MKRGRKPYLFCPDHHELALLVTRGEHTIGALCELYGVGRKTLVRWLDEHGLPRPSLKIELLPGEEWRAVVGFEGLYEVSNMGRVRGLDRVVNGVRVKGRLMRPYRDRPKYSHMIIQLSRGTGKAGAAFPLVHKLVLEAFVGPRPDGMVACHNNGDGTDNRLANLRWDTLSANQRDSFKHGTHHWLRHHEMRRQRRLRDSENMG